MNWIKLSEREPPKNTWVFVSDGKAANVAKLIDNLSRIWADRLYTYPYDSVTHWAEIVPPKGGLDG